MTKPATESECLSRVVTRLRERGVGVRLLREDEPERVTVAQVYREFVYQPEAFSASQWYGLQGDQGAGPGDAPEGTVYELPKRLEAGLGQALDMPLKRLLLDPAAAREVSSAH